MKSRSTTRKARVISDPVDIVPLLIVFCNEKKKRAFEELSSGWKREKELKELVGEEASEALNILEESNLLESNWKIPNPGEKPEKEYHSSYVKLVVNFQCSLKEFNDLIRVVMKKDEELKEMEKNLIEAISSNKSINSVAMLSKRLNMSQIFLKAIIKRSSRISIRGERIEIS